MKYKNENRDSYFTSPTEPSVNASNALFLLSFVNVLLAIIMQAAVIDSDGLTAFSLYGMTLFHEVVYIPLLVVWLMQAFGSYD